MSKLEKRNADLGLKQKFLYKKILWYQKTSLVLALEVMDEWKKTY